MPRLTELTEPGPLAPQVAAWLIGQSPVARWVDLSDWTVIVPTSSAGRKLRLVLAESADRSGKGLLPPRILTPMQLFPSLENEASRLEQLRAWAETIRQVNPDEFPELFGAFSAALDPAQSLRVAGPFLDLAAMLAEAGLTPDSPEVARVGDLESARWAEIGTLYQKYRAALGRPDPNTSKIAAALAPIADSGRFVIVGVPDLPRIVRQFLEKRSVDILVACPPGVPREFGEWGQPRLEFWQAALTDLPGERIVVAGNPALEAGTVFSQWQPGIGLCCADETFKPRLIRQLAEAGLSAYDPAGVSLLALEAGRLTLAWWKFLRTRALADLRLLLESPRVLRWLGGDSLELLRDLDRLTERHLLTTLPDARTFYKNLEIVPAWLETLENRCDEFGSDRIRGWLAEIFADEQWTESANEAMALRELAAALTEIARVWDESTPAYSELLAQSALETRRIYPQHPADAIELNGWLEALWMEETALIVSGCVEGNLPDLVLGHPFLPDSARAELGIASNATRFVRDAYLLSCVLAQRPAGSVWFTLSRRGEDGSPLKPSRLLLRCADAELADRVEQLFHLPGTDRRPAARQLPFKLHLDPPQPPTALSATDFSQYLRCPLRYYLQRVRRMVGIDSGKRELDPAEFGTVLHKVLEMFGRNEAIRDSTNENEIRQFVHEEMQRQFFARFGVNPGAPLRVQMETMRARLSAFARVQALEAAAGWRILETERAFKGEETIRIGDFPIHATLDRIERNERTGEWRVLDYKSHANSPEKKHLGSIGKNPPVVEEAVFMEGKPQRWLDLQLPIYRGIFEHHWRGESAPEVGYFLLPADLQALQITTLPLPDERLEAAFVCARAIADRIARGVFLPAAILNPREDDFASLFLGEDPADLLDSETLEAFSGQS